MILYKYDVLSNSASSLFNPVSKHYLRSLLSSLRDVFAIVLVDVTQLSSIWLLSLWSTFVQLENFLFELLKQNGSKIYSPFCWFAASKIQQFLLDFLLHNLWTPDFVDFSCFSTSGVIIRDSVIELSYQTKNWNCSPSDYFRFIFIMWFCSSVVIIPKMHSLFLGPSTVRLRLIRCTIALHEYFPRNWIL